METGRSHMVHKCKWGDENDMRSIRTHPSAFNLLGGSPCTIAKSRLHHDRATCTEDICTYDTSLSTWGFDDHCVRGLMILVRSED
ncbi:hypothetical protein TIFTF001_003817 [Ficus carica]|uniref:Uncharacterized protein n=1 Tax=Ficus carica TaxID=3494 RepID=A0AA88CWN6_FICCA|nr:hypothetical protein TIFTF001_003817 [Ficus carica]